jgi:2-aminoadipate transaminase
LSVDSLAFSSATSRVEWETDWEMVNLIGRPDVISFAGAFPSRGAFDIDGLCKATNVAVKQSATASFQSGATGGFAPLKALLVQREKSKGISVDESHMLLTSGSEQAVDLVCRILVNPGDSVVVEAPCHFGALHSFLFHGAQITALKADDEGIDIEELARVAEEKRPKFVYLAANFSDPTGRSTSLRRRKQILDVASKFGFFVVEDDTYGELYFNEPPPPSMLALADDHERDWVIHISSSSKILSPGLRLAWMFARSELIRHATLAKQMSDANSTSLSQVVAFHYLNSGSLEPTLSRIRQFHLTQATAMKKAIKAELDDRIFKCDYPDGGMFFWGKVEGCDTRELLKPAIASGVAFVPGSAFFPGNPGTDRLRLSFATATTDQISKGIKRLASVIDSCL